jgi:hypothetical protein
MNVAPLAIYLVFGLLLPLLATLAVRLKLMPRRTVYPPSSVDIAQLFPSERLAGPASG